MTAQPRSGLSTRTILWFEQSLKPSERPQLVAHLLKALSGPGEEAVQSESAKTFAGKDAEQNT